MRKMIFLFALILGGIFFNGNILNAQVEDNDYRMVVVEEVYFFDELDYAFYQSFFIKNQVTKKSKNSLRPN